MTQTLRVGRGLTLPLDAVTQTFGILAKRRVGKTYTASVMAEEFADAGIPFVALDPTGAWWGLRSSADGKRGGIPVIILGGAHGDVPLERTGGKLVADLVVDHPGFYVLDLESFDSSAAQDQFVADFLERLYRRQANKRDPLHVFIDEADSFAPQRPAQGQLRMLGATEALVRRGGIRGIGTTLITQRAAVLNKNVLTQLDVLIALQITGPQDIEAIRDWTKSHGTKEQQDQLLGSLASLGRGEAWVWSPGWLDIFKRVVIRERRTFNSSATPAVGAAVVEPAKLATVDLEAIRSAMAATIEKQKADDPKELRKRITVLEAEIAHERRSVASFEETLKHRKPERIEVEKIVEVPVLKPEERQALVGTIAAIVREGMAQIEAELRRFGDLLDDALDMPAVQRAKVPPEIRALPQRLPSTVSAPSPGPLAESIDRGVSLSQTSGDGESPALRAGARKMLGILARHFPLTITRAQLGTLAGMAHTGGTFGTYLSTMKRSRYVTEAAGHMLTITPTGLAAAGVEPGNPMSADEIRETWRRPLRAGARKMFDAIVAVYPEPIPREELARLTEMEASGGTFGTYLSILRRNGLADVANHGVAATDVAVGRVG